MCFTILSRIYFWMIWLSIENKRSPHYHINPFKTFSTHSPLLSHFIITFLHPLPFIMYIHIVWATSHLTYFKIYNSIFFEISYYYLHTIFKFYNVYCEIFFFIIIFVIHYFFYYINKIYGSVNAVWIEFYKAYVHWLQS